MQNSSVRSTVCFARLPRSRPLTASRGVHARSICPKSGALTTAGSRRLPSASHRAGSSVVAAMRGSKGKTSSNRSPSAPSLPLNSIVSPLRSGMHGPVDLRFGGGQMKSHFVVPVPPAVACQPNRSSPLEPVQRYVGPQQIVLRVVAAVRVPTQQRQRRPVAVGSDAHHRLPYSGGAAEGDDVSRAGRTVLPRQRGVSTLGGYRADRSNQQSACTSVQPRSISHRLLRSRRRVCSFAWGIGWDSQSCFLRRRRVRRD